MKQWAIIALPALLCIVMFGCRKEQQVEVKADQEVKQAEDFVTALHAGNFTTAVEQFDATMAAALPVEKLAQTWQALEAQAGSFQRQLDSRTEEATENGQAYQAIIITCEFERAKIDVKTVYDAEGKISGLWFLPSGQ